MMFRLLKPWMREWKIMWWIMKQWSMKHLQHRKYLLLPDVTHMYSNCLYMYWNVNPVSGQSLYIMKKSKPLYQRPLIRFRTIKEFLHAAAHWSHCLAWKIRCCQMPGEWPDSKSVTRLRKQPPRAPAGPEARPQLTQTHFCELHSHLSIPSASLPFLKTFFNPSLMIQRSFRVNNEQRRLFFFVWTQVNLCSGMSHWWNLHKLFILM